MGLIRDKKFNIRYGGNGYNTINSKLHILCAALYLLILSYNAWTYMHRTVSISQVINANKLRRLGMGREREH